MRVSLGIHPQRQRQQSHPTILRCKKIKVMSVRVLIGQASVEEDRERESHFTFCSYLTRLGIAALAQKEAGTLKGRIVYVRWSAAYMCSWAKLIHGGRIYHVVRGRHPKKHSCPKADARPNPVWGL